MIILSKIENCVKNENLGQKLKIGSKIENCAKDRKLGQKFKKNGSKIVKDRKLGLLLRNR